MIDVNRLYSRSMSDAQAAPGAEDWFAELDPDDRMRWIRAWNSKTVPDELAATLPADHRHDAPVPWIRPVDGYRAGVSWFDRWRVVAPLSTELERQYQRYVHSLR